ncbi:S8 family serine peptidase [bacterium]|nr:S8 family serine peptidase [bacterium]
MMNPNAKSLIMPWSRHNRLYSVPGRLTLKLALGEAPEGIPSALDVRSGAADPLSKIDGGAIDRILRKHGGAVRVARLHNAARSLGLPGARHRGFDDVEHALGLARTFRIDTLPGCCIHHLVDALRQLSYVEQVSPYYVCATPFIQPAPAEFDLEQAWLPRLQVNAPEALAYEPGDSAVIIAVVDTGVAQTHPELANRLRPGLDTVQLGTHDLATGLLLRGDRSEVDTDPEDEVGHGTSCAAIMGAAGSRIPPGLAGASGLLPLRVLGAAQLTGKSEAIGIGAIADIDMGVKTAIDLGAHVINMSFGTRVADLDEDDPLPHEDVVRYGKARGCLMVAASGNSGVSEEYVPAAYNEVIAVASVDGEGNPSSFNTTGSHVNLCAPGDRVVSAGLRDYQLVTGTSFAAPFVSATAALLVSRSRRRSHPVAAETISRILAESARAWKLGRGEGCGVGVLDALAALRALDREIDGTTAGGGHA